MSEIKIRFATVEDAEALVAIYAHYVENTAVSFEYEVPTVEEFQRRIKKTAEKYPYLVAEKEGTILGYTYVGAFMPRPAYQYSVETSIYLNKDSRRLGVGTMLYKALEEELKKQNIITMNACIAYPSGDDPYLTMDSVLFHEKMGYRMVGRFDQSGYKFHRWYDMVWMEKHIGEHPTNPKEIVWRYEM